MLFSLFSQGDIRQAIIDLLLILPTILISLSFHEAAHAWLAYKMGDRTAYNLGRVSLNPAKHLDPIGSIAMLLFGYGWAKPVPINPRNFRSPKHGMAYTAIAGPISNFILGLIGILMYFVTMYVAKASSVMVFVDHYTYYQLTDNDTLCNVFLVLMRFFQYFGIMNFILTVFNMLPLPPFDGSRFFSLFLPDRYYFEIMRYERYSLLIILGISFLCSRVLGFSPFSFAAEKIWDLFYWLLFNLYTII